MAAKRKWGERVDGTPLITHKGAYYLDVLPTSKPGTAVYIGEDGRPLEKALLEPYMAAERDDEPSDTQGVSVPIRPRDLKITGIQYIRLAGNLHQVTH